jgi:hypothetical protein
MRRSVRSPMQGLAALALPMLLGATGCNTFKYFDVNVTFNEAIDDTAILAIQRCRILVSGADTGNFILNDCPNRAPDPMDPHTDVGPFEFSTFADSGTMTFEFKGFGGLQDTAACQIADGTLSLPVTSATTIPGTLTVNMTGPGCSNVSTGGDGGQ